MRRRGFTQIELLIACTLLLLVLTLAFGYLVPATRAAYRFRTRSHLQQSCAVVMSKIMQAAATTSPGGFSWSSGPGAIALGFNPVDRLQPADGALLWTAVYDLFWWDQTSHTLRQRRWPPGPPSLEGDEGSVVRAKRLPTDRLAAVVAASDAYLTLARGVTAFEVTQRGTAGTLIQPVRVRITLVEEGRESTPDGAPTFSISSTFRLENQQ